MLAGGRDGLDRLAPGHELLVTTAQLLTILRLSVGDAAPAHEKQLLEVAARMPDYKTHNARPVLSIAKTSTE